MLRDSRDIIRRLRISGFELVTVRGSHHKFLHPGKPRIVIVPHPKSDLPAGTVRPFISRRPGRRTDVAHYIALIHKETDSSYGVSFPDVPGVVTSGRSIDEAMTEAGRVLAFAAEDWASLAGAAFPAPRTVDELREDPDFREAATDAVLAAVPLRTPVDAAA